MFITQSLQRTSRESSRLWRELKPMDPKENRTIPFKKTTYVKMYSEPKSARSLGLKPTHRTNVRYKNGYQGRESPNVGIKGCDMKDKRYHKCSKFVHFQAACPTKVSIKANHVCTADQMLKGGFVAKISSQSQGQIFYISRTKSMKECFMLG